MPSPLSFASVCADVAIPGGAAFYVLAAFGGYMLAVFTLGYVAHHLLERGSFLKEYFLGDRQLNAWVLSLTYVATSVSAGSFVGFPSLIYTNGWVMALWISGYMVTGLVAKGVLAKRLNQISRLSGSITVPDVLRDRFQSPALGSLAGLLLLFFLLFNLVGQFKAGGLIMRQACRSVEATAVYRQARSVTAEAITKAGLWKGAEASAEGGFYGRDYPDYVLGILIFSLTVVAYTTYGGFWAVTWTDVLQGLVIVFGALALMVLSLLRVGSLEQATTRLRDIDPQLLAGPGPANYLPLGMAVSFFFLWTIGAMGQPVGMVRLMACRDTPTLRRALFMIGLYYSLIYLPLVVTFVCARAIYPTEYVGGREDSIMPVMALTVTQDWPLLGGLILAAPYAAAMSAVAGFLLLMSSSIVRDIYQRNFNPNVSPRVVRWVSYVTTAVVGTLVTVVSLHPPERLQLLIIFTGAGMGCTYLAPIVMALYWKRATRAGALAAMLGGFLGVTLFWVLGWMGFGKAGKTGPNATDFAPLYLFELDPMIYGLLISFALGIVVSLLTRPMPPHVVNPYFLEDEPPPPESTADQWKRMTGRS